MWSLLMGLAMASNVLERVQWSVVNDTVMGGVSSGQVEVADAVRFTGELSLEQNGGFASIRSRPVRGLMEGATALRVHVRGDDRTWDLTLRRADVPIRAGSYRVPIQATKEGQIIDVPLSAFRPTSFGRAVVGAPALDAGVTQIESVGFLLGDGNPGPFELEVLSVEVLHGDTARGDTHADIVRQLTAVLDVGVPLFNNGDLAGCRDAYAAALGGIVNMDGLTAGEHALVREALDASATEPAGEGAWTLRHAIDSVLWSRR